MKTEIAVLALVVAVSGCVGGLGGDSPAADTSQPESETSEPASLEDMNTVYLTDEGFEPSSITIYQGETVTWVNNASGEMWIGSDRHPTHTQYSGSTLREHCEDGDQTEAAFDQCSTGSRFSFTFEKTGEWSYHNHERASQTGTVIVE